MILEYTLLLHINVVNTDEAVHAFRNIMNEYYSLNKAKTMEALFCVSVFNYSVLDRMNVHALEKVPKSMI